MVAQKGEEGVSQPATAAVIIHACRLQYNSKWIIKGEHSYENKIYLSTNLVATLADLDMDDFTHYDLI